MSSFDHETLTKTVEEVRSKVLKFKDRTMNEQSTKAALIEPILRALGWDTHDPDEVHHEFKNQKKDNPVDYALKINRRPRLFVEAKALDEDLNAYKWLQQVLGYATMAGVSWCVLTNGDKYKIYNASASVDATNKLFHDVCISADSTSAVTTVLTLVSRPKLESNLIDIEWERHTIDKQVKKELAKLFGGPDPSLINLLKKKLPSWSKKQLTSSVRRFEVSFEPPPLPSQASTPSPLGKSKTKKKAGKKPKFFVSISDLIGAKLIKPPTDIFASYLKTRVEAVLQPNGSVRFDGVEYDSPTAAGEMAKAKVSGKPLATNGWTFWQLSKTNGQICSLDDIRQEFLATK